MKKIYWCSLLVMIAILFFQCQKQVSFIGNPDPGVEVDPAPITTSVQGNVIDENNLPIAGIVIAAGTGTAITDQNGYFHITKVVLDKNTSLITAEKDGYFKSYRVFAATSGCNQVVFKMIPRTIAGTIAASSGGDATLNDGTKISLPANSIVTASAGTSYAGNVSVYTSYINPKANDIGTKMPGSFVANTKDGKRVTFASFGIVAVELNSTGGEKLQVKSGSLASITIPIPAASLAAAPANIPLWYLDEATGLWQEEGTAAKQGNNYVGDVKHFSFWSTGISFAGVPLSFTLQTPDGLPLVNAYVHIAATDSAGGAVYGFTDSLGQASGLVPANTSLALDVLGSCGSIVYSQTITPLTQSTDLGTITINNSSSLLTISGSLVDCSSAPVTNGYVIINFNGATRYVATDGAGMYTTTYVVCPGTPGTATLLGVNVATQQQSEVNTVSITSPATDAGSIAVCSNPSSDQYINYTIDGTDYNITSAAGDSLIGYTDSFLLSRIFGTDYASDYLSFLTSAQDTGTYSLHALSLTNSGDTVNIIEPMNISFAKFPAVAGQYYEGNFSGSYRNTPVTAAHTITATFRIRRFN